MHDNMINNTRHSNNIASNLHEGQGQIQLKVKYLKVCIPANYVWQCYVNYLAWSFEGQGIV